MFVRTAKQSDTDAISALLERCYPVLMATSYAPEILAVALPKMTKANPNLIASDNFYLVEHDEIIVGCGGWSFETPGTGTIVQEVAHIRHFAVDPTCCRQGIGKAIYQQCAKAARLQGATKMQAFSSLNAELFYQNMGLVRLQQLNIHLDGQIEFPVIVMEGSLVE